MLLWFFSETRAVFICKNYNQNNKIRVTVSCMFSIFLTGFCNFWLPVILSNYRKFLSFSFRNYTRQLKILFLLSACQMELHYMSNLSIDLIWIDKLYFTRWIDCLINQVLMYFVYFPFKKWCLSVKVVQA